MLTMPRTRRLYPKRRYASRRDDMIVFTLTIEREAAELLHHYVGEGRLHARFLARLIYEHHARQQERQRLAREGGQVLATAAHEE
jgi:hypothetical protein